MGEFKRTHLQDIDKYATVISFILSKENLDWDNEKNYKAITLFFFSALSIDKQLLTKLFRLKELYDQKGERFNFDAVDIICDYADTNYEMRYGSYNGKMTVHVEKIAVDWVRQLRILRC